MKKREPTPVEELRAIRVDLMVAEHNPVGRSKSAIRKIGTRLRALEKRIGSIAPSLLADEWQRVSPAAVERWLEENGYHSVSCGFSAVTLPDYDGDPGITFERTSMAEACALADRFMNEVEGPDDVGHDECVRQVQEWLRANDPNNPAIEAA